VFVLRLFLCFSAFVGEKAKSDVAPDVPEVEAEASASFVPSWGLTNDAVLNTLYLCREFMYSTRTPAEVEAGARMSNKRLSNSSCQSAVDHFFHFIELHERFVENVNAKLKFKAQVDELREKESKLMSDNAELRKMVAELQHKCSSLEEEKKGYEALSSELEVSKEQVLKLEADVSPLEGDRHWLISHGMGQAFEKIRNSDGFLDMLADVQSLADKVGFKAGIFAGMSIARTGKKPTDVSGYMDDALDQLQTLSHEFDRATFPVVGEIAAMSDRSLAEIQAFLAPPAP
jgi:FtsZ-binding cell division protein ZapB